MMPPSRCCTILFWPVATNVPWVITAAASGAVAPQTPKAPKQPMVRVSPMIACLRIERGTSAYQARSCMLPASEVRVIEPVP